MSTTTLFTLLLLLALVAMLGLVVAPAVLVESPSPLGARWRALGPFWLRVPALRAVAETMLLAGIFVLIALLLAPGPAGDCARRVPEVQGSRAFCQVASVDPMLLLLAGPGCALWCAVRLRLTQGTWWRIALLEGTIGTLLGLLPFTVIVVTVLLVAPELGAAPSAIFARGIRGVPVPLFAVLLLIAFSLEFVVFRLGVRLWLRWNRLRRTQLQWSMTHGLLSVAALCAGVIILLTLLLALNVGRLPATALAPFIIFLLVLSAIGLLVVLPPSAIFSYLFARYLTRRLHTLIAATNQLSAGEYAARVPVDGEDEVAQLQANFNAMAADLEQAVCELRAERDRVATLLRARRELVASVSHELRTPVATLRGYLESARRQWDGEGQTPPAMLRHDLEVMERETVHLQALINDLFALSRAEVGQLDLRIEPADVGALARRVAETAAPLAWQAHRVQVVAEVAAGTPRALVDASRLEQALSNLLHNGIRHTPPGGIVAVEAAPDAEGGIVVRVKDTGEGIAPEDLPRVWERFFRAERDRERADGGSGLGLALVKELTEAMGGSVAVESELGRGSCFTLRLLAAGGTPKNSARKAPGPDVTSGAPMMGERAADTVAV